MTQLDQGLDTTRRELIEGWLVWQSSKPLHQRLFFNFHAQVVQNDPKFQHFSLLDTLAILNTLGSFTQHNV